MQRRQGISAHAEFAPVEPDVAARLSAALNRLAALRATLHGDWSDGPASLLAHANRDGDDCAPPCWTLNDRPAPALDIPAQRESPPAIEALRGRFESAEAKTPPTAAVDVSWLDLVEDATIIELDFATPGWTDADAGESEVAVATAFAEDCAATAVVCVLPRPAPEAAMVEIDDVEPVFAVGAAPELTAFVVSPAPAPKAVSEQSLAASDEIGRASCRERV